MQITNPWVQECIHISYDIYNELGAGYSETIYHKAFETALRLKNIRYQSEVITPIFYKGFNIGHGRIDLMINNQVIVELKAISNFNNDTANIQIKNYLKHYNLSEGLIVNFGQQNRPTLNIKYINPENKVYTLIDGHFIDQSATEMVIN